MRWIKYKYFRRQ